MTTRRFPLLAALLGLALANGAARAADASGDYGMKSGTADLKSAGPLAFGPGGVLFVGDPQGGAVFAIDTNDKATGATGALNVPKIDGRISSLLGSGAGEIAIADMAVNPSSGNVYFSVARGRGPEAPPVLLKLDRKGEFSEVSLKDVKFAKAMLPNPVGNGKARAEAITGLAFVSGKLYVAGLSSEDFSSNLRAIPFPFNAVDKGASIEIYHGAHGKLETNSPVRTFTTYEISGQAHLLAAYTCTPLVRIPVSDLKPGAKVKGTTVAELGNRNRPLDMVVYQKGGKDYLLMANSARGVMKIDLEKVGTQDGISARVQKTAGLAYETIETLKGVEQLTKLDNEHGLILVKSAAGVNLETIDLP